MKKEINEIGDKITALLEDTRTMLAEINRIRAEQEEMRKKFLRTLRYTVKK